MTGVRVLVVDDSEEMRDVLVRILARSGQGWQVVGTATDGQDGVDKVVDTSPDLVLLDVAMPVMDGLEALPLIRRLAPQTVVVMLSGFPTDTGGPAAVAAGAHGYLEKADLVRTLVPQLDEILEQARAG